MEPEILSHNGLKKYLMEPGVPLHKYINFMFRANDPKQ